MDREKLAEAVEWWKANKSRFVMYDQAWIGQGFDAARRLLEAETFEIECVICEGMGETYGCPEQSPDICVSCDHGDLDHVIDCPEYGGSGVWSVIRSPLVPRLLADPEETG